MEKSVAILFNGIGARIMSDRVFEKQVVFIDASRRRTNNVARRKGEEETR